MIFHCCEERRLEVLRRSATTINAVEHLEVLDRAAPPDVPRQRTLFVRLLRPAPGLAATNVRITGGTRIRDVDIEWLAMADQLPPQAEPDLTTGLTEPERTLVVRTASAGDFSRYTFALVTPEAPQEPAPGFDPVLNRVDFSFKVECPADLDCDAPLPCPPRRDAPPRIDYLAKDYQGFRRLMLDRLALLTPGWTERSAADAGVALVELLAYAADNLSYRQDVIANEAYLNTARQRVSVRRHARLVDYHLHEGCNARAFVQVRLPETTATPTLPERTVLLTRVPDLPAALDADQERVARASGSQAFETVHAQPLHFVLNDISFYTWGDEECCLPRGATRATLALHLPLVPGDFLVLVEILDPETGLRENANREHRHVVRLTSVEHDEDPVGALFTTGQETPLPITRVEWHAADALPFTLCLSTEKHRDTGLALGNIVLVEHGEEMPVEPLPPVPGDRAAPRARAKRVGECCEPEDMRRAPLRFRPALARLPLTHGFDLADLLAQSPQQPHLRWSAAALRALHPRDAMPRIGLDVKDAAPPTPWSARRDLLRSDGAAPDFVVEIEDDGRARLRFGDGVNGQRPDADTAFLATYRCGNGAVGNVGAEAIAHALAVGFEIASISNPMPAFGGADPEDIEAARRDAPQAFRTQRRAVTAADYADAAGRLSDVQRAAATFRWTGSWHTVFVSADRRNGAAVDADFESGLRSHLERFRMAGYDLEVDEPRFVPLDVVLHVCVKAGHFRAEVVRAVRAALSNTLLPDGSRGAFHPDNFSFGDPVFASRIVAIAQSIEGVESVRLERFQRLVDPNPASLADGEIRLGRLEVARLDNDPNYRERGRLTVNAGGGQ